MNIGNTIRTVRKEKGLSHADSLGKFHGKTMTGNEQSKLNINSARGAGRR